MRKRRTAADKARTFHHRMRAGTRIPAAHRGCRCTVVEMSFGWSELMPAMLEALEKRNTPRSAKDEIKRELLKLAAAVDAQRGKMPRTIIRGFPRD